MATKSLNKKWLSIVQSTREKGENEVGGSSTITELLLQTGQVNDALHAIHLALADKAILFQHDVHQAESQVTNTQAWGRIKSVNAVLRRYVAIYRKCHSAMVSLGAEAEVLQ